MTSTNLAQRARYRTLTVAEVNVATKEKLEEDIYVGITVLYHASIRCGIDIVEAILDKNVNIDGLSGNVSIIIYYYIMITMY
jgi:hypothetical protein